MATVDDPYDRYRLVSLVSGAEARVLVRRDVYAEFLELEERKQAQLIARMDLWSDGRRMSSEHFNANEGRCKKGDINRMLQAFKTHKIRLFGFVRPLLSFKSFIIVDVDPAKKQDKANKRVIARAFDRVVEFEEEFGD